jgi:hypothetical protein
MRWLFNTSYCHHRTTCISQSNRDGDIRKGGRVVRARWSPWRRKVSWTVGWRERLPAQKSESFNLDLPCKIQVLVDSTVVHRHHLLLTGETAFDSFADPKRED